ncbi:MAG: hypothetical protein ACYCVD_17790 [Desulfitobacteriaceae bacterium]
MNLKKRLPLLLLLLSMTLTGCGAGVSSVPVGGSPPTTSPNGTATSQSVPLKLNLKSPQGQKELDQKVDQKLQSLDQALDSLDKSLGKIQ